MYFVQCLYVLFIAQRMVLRNLDSLIADYVKLMDIGNLQTFRHICIISNLKTQKKKFVVLVGFEPEPARLALQLMKVTFWRQNTSPELVF